MNTTAEPRRDHDVFSTIIRTLNENSSSRTNQRRRALQQRSFGFPCNEMESFEVIRQNMASIEQIKNSSLTMFVTEEITSLIPNPKPFDKMNRRFDLGQWVDVKDTIDQWLEAEIIDFRDDEVKVHYNGWGSIWDEWIPVNR